MVFAYLTGIEKYEGSFDKGPFEKGLTALKANSTEDIKKNLGELTKIWLNNETNFKKVWEWCFKCVSTGDTMEETVYGVSFCKLFLKKKYPLSEKWIDFIEKKN